MTLLCDFQTIIGDNAQTVRPQPSGDPVQLGVVFRTGGRIAGSSEVDRPQTSSRTAFLSYSVRGMVGTAQVFVNHNGPVGLITASSGTAWSTQFIAMAGERLNDGDNTITVQSITDQFEIKDLICFYHQDSD
jgi:hypothetical protein